MGSGEDKEADKMIELTKNKKEKSSHLAAVPVNPDGEPVSGFCPECFGVNVYRDVTDRDWKVWRMFHGLPYYCMDCKTAFETLAEDYIPKDTYRKQLLEAIQTFETKATDDERNNQTR